MFPIGQPRTVTAERWVLIGTRGLRGPVAQLAGVLIGAIRGLAGYRRSGREDDPVPLDRHGVVAGTAVAPVGSAHQQIRRPHPAVQVGRQRAGRDQRPPRRESLPAGTDPRLDGRVGQATKVERTRHLRQPAVEHLRPVRPPALEAGCRGRIRRRAGCLELGRQPPGRHRAERVLGLHRAAGRRRRSEQDRRAHAASGTAFDGPSGAQRRPPGPGATPRCPRTGFAIPHPASRRRRSRRPTPAGQARPGWIRPGIRRPTGFDETSRAIRGMAATR